MNSKKIMELAELIASICDENAEDDKDNQVIGSTEYTILEVANLLGLTKNTIKYRMKKLPKSMVRTGDDGMGTIYISAKGLEELMKMGNTERKRSTCENCNHCIRNRIGDGCLMCKKHSVYMYKGSWCSNYEPRNT